MTAPTDAELLVWGYAPGNYMSSCAACGGDMRDVDKDCLVCRPCAVKRWRYDRANHPERYDGPLCPQCGAPLGVGAEHNRGCTQLPFVDTLKAQGFDVDGRELGRGVVGIGRATWDEKHQRWQCMADVSGALCVVAVDVKP